MKGKRRKLQALLLALLLLVGPAPLRALADEETAEVGQVVELTTPEDLLAFSKNCALDTWSQGKTFALAADLDLTGRDFSPIPTFGGTFLGQGHTISGLRLTASGSTMGLFRFLQPGGVVRDLTVSGRVAPEGSAGTVGGLVGSNAGSLENCAFQGTVTGEVAVGGLVGENLVTGEVAGCSVSGAVSGETCTGGIAGRNQGVLLKCRSDAEVNTSAPSTDAAVTGSALEQIASPDASGEGEGLFSSHSDTGGVAGHSSGVIQSCVNDGTVGYPHVGYNVGGIVGRQAGYLADCANRGAVYGRKDVGGIVGQAEPDIILNAGEDTLNRLRQELNTLNSLVDRALDHAGTNREQVSAQLTALGQTAGDARDHTKDLLDHVSDVADSDLETINTLSSAVTAALDGLSPALDSLSDASDSLGTLGEQLRGGLDTLAASGSLADEALAAARSAADDLGGMGDQLSAAAQDMKNAAEDLQEAIILRDQAALQAANRKLVAAIRDLGAAMRTARSALDSLERALDSGLPGGGDAIDAVRGIKAALGNAGDALDRAGLALDTILTNVDLDWAMVQSGLDTAGDALDSLSQAAKALRDATDDLGETMTAAGDVTDALGAAAGQFSDASHTGSAVAGHLQAAFDTLRDVTRQLARDGDVQLTPLGQEARDAGDGLYTSLSGLSQNLADLHDAVDGAGAALEEDLRAISRQMNKIFDLMLDAMDNVTTAEAPEDLFGDLSEEDVGGTRLGKVKAGVNTGAVAGDRNVGGVAGAVAVEYSLDPEDDVERFSFGSTYELKAILQDCVNRGPVEARRDCVGGIVGRMDLGTATGCESYGPVTGSDSYVGGVAGYADAALRNCWVKCTLSGTEYVGGVAGWGDRITDCRAIPTILEGTEFLGAIAGDADREGGEVRGNRFLDTGVAGIDGVSYAGVAQSVPFDDLQAEATAPVDFLTFTMTLLVEDEVLERLPFRYGDDLSALTLPPVPEKEGCYGTWSDFDPQGIHSDLTVEAVYTPWVTLAASRETEGQLALALAEGQFTQDVLLTVQPSQTEPPEGGEAGQVWEVSLVGADLSEGAPLPLRLLNRQGKRAAVWQLVDGAWQRRESRANGSYLCLTMDGTSGVFCVCPAPFSPLPALLAAGAAALVVLAAVLLAAGRRRKKRKKERAASSV